MNQSKTDKQPQHDKPKSSFTSKPITYILSVAVLAIIAVALIGGPAIGGASRRGQVSFGEYDGVEITVSPGGFFARAYQNVAAYYQSVCVEITEQVYLQVWQSAFYQTVFHLALLSEADSAGVGVSTEAVDRAIAVWPEFQVNGSFSAEEYQSMHSADLMILREYLEEGLIADAVRADYATTGTFSDAELEFFASMASPEKRFKYVEFSFTSFPDSEVITYGEENLERFARINVSQITIDSSESDAESIRQQALDRTASFEDLARNQSQDEFAESGGERGWVYYWDLEFDFEDVAGVDELFALDEGEISAVHPVGTRWRIYKVNEVPVEPDFTDDETVQEVRSYISSFERGRIEDYLRVAADAFVAEARDADFETAATTIDQLPQLTEYFPINFGNSTLFPQVSASANATFSSSAAYREEFFETLFALEAGEVSDPQVIRDYVFVFQLDDARELTPEELEERLAAIPGQLEQIVLGEATDGVVRDDLFVDNFVETYYTAVLGR